MSENIVVSQLVVTVSGLAFGGISEIQLFTPTKAYTEDKSFLESGKKERASARQLVPPRTMTDKNPLTQLPRVRH